MRRERTTGQVLVGAGPSGLLPQGVLQLFPTGSSDWFRKVRLMRRDATVGFLRDVYMAPMLSAEWTVVCDDPAFDEAVDFIHDNTIPYRVKFLRDTLRGLLDFGWQGFEVVKAQSDEGEFVVEKYKPLLQDLTTILVDYHGRLIGLQNIASYSQLNPNPVHLFRGDCLTISRDVEGTNWYSEPLMRRCERPFDTWNECDDGARRFDVKVAGAHWVVYYPVGRTRYNQGVTKVDNAIIAQDILAALSASGKVAIPQAVLKQVDELNTLDQSKMGWRIELISAQTQQAQFIDRLKYIDSLKCRAFGIPERAILEGQFGTKAEAEAHADFAVDNIEMTHKEIIAQFNEQNVNPLLEFNFGPAFVGKIRVQPASLNDDKRALLKQLYTSFIATDDGRAEVLDRIDWKGIEEELGVPVRQSHGDEGQDESPDGPIPSGAEPAANPVGHVQSLLRRKGAKRFTKDPAAASLKANRRRGLNGYTTAVTS